MEAPMASIRERIGLAVIVVALLVLAPAWVRDDLTRYEAGLFLLLSGLSLLLSGLYARHSQEANHQLPADALAKDSPGSQARLGELLVSRYGLITQQELDQALDQQRGTLKMLGEILVEMGLINEATLRLVLSQQAPPAPEPRQTGT
jgi:hypothetical protein